MKLKQVIMLVLIGLPLDVYCPAEPAAQHEVSYSHETKSSASHTTAAEKSQQAEQQKAQDQKASQEKSSQTDASAVPVKSSLKSSSTSNKSKSVSFGDDSTQTFTVEEPTAQDVQDQDYDAGTRITDKQINSPYDQATDDNNFHNQFTTHLTAEEFSNLTLDEQNEYLSNANKNLWEGEIASYKAVMKSQKDAAIKLAKDLETEAKSAKTDEDVKIIIKKIDPQGKLTPEVIDEAVQASKIWRNPFNGSAWERFVEVLSRTVSYATKGKPFSKESVESLKKLVTDHADSIKIDKDAKRAEEVKQAKIQELDNQIAVKNDDLEAVNKDISDIQTQITIKQNDIETHVQTNYIIKTRSLGDSQVVIELEAQITQLRSKLIESQKEASKLLQDMRQLEDQKNSMSSQEELFKESESSDVSTSSKKEESLCDTVEACVERIKDPKDSNSLSKILARVGELAKNPDVMKNLTQDQIDAVNFFVKNGDKIINNFKSLTWSETYSLMKYKDSLPTLKGSKPLDTSVLISKSSKESELVKSEQQQIAAQSSSSLFA